MDDLIKEYKKTLKRIRKEKSVLKEEPDQDADVKSEYKIYCEIERDLLFAIEWMQKGKNPNATRGIERRAAYQIAKPMDPLIIQQFFRSEETEYSWDKAEKESCLSTGDKLTISAVLSILTEKERELYLMSKGYSLSYSEIARKLNIAKQTARRTVIRAENKIANFMKEKKEEDCYEYSAAN